MRELGADAVRLGIDKLGCDAEIRLGNEAFDFVFTLHDESHGHRLDTSGRQCRLDLLPEHGRKLEAYDAVEHAARLLGVDEVDVDVARVGDGVDNGVLGDFVEDDAAGVFGLETEHIIEMPGNGLTLAVLIGSEPHHLCVVGGFLEVAHKLLLIGRHFIFRLERIVHINAEILFAQVANMTVARHYFIVFTKKFLYCLSLGRRFDNHQIFNHRTHYNINGIVPVWNSATKLEKEIHIIRHRNKNLTRPSPL